MAPSDYIQSRHLASLQVAHPSPYDYYYFATQVDGRPYLPNFNVNVSSSSSMDGTSVRRAALVMVVHSIVSNDDAFGDAQGVGMRESRTQLLFKPTLSLLSSMDWDSLLLATLPSLTCTKVTGGITNALFRVSGLHTIKPQIMGAIGNGNLLDNKDEEKTLSIMNGMDAQLNFDSVLIRIFGAEGMIDRDIETSTYATLCDANIAHQYLGRFQNGRVEGWLEGYTALTCTDLASGKYCVGIAKEMARLHCKFQFPEGELKEHHFGKDNDAVKVGMWDQLSSWMEQAKGYTEFKTHHDTDRVKKLDLNRIEHELQQLISSFRSNSSQDGDKCRKKIVFCHNDLLPANIMVHQQTNIIQFIDFEYGGANYAAYDVANHFNEYAGGTSSEDNGVPNYSRFPSPDEQERFCNEYVREVRRYLGEDSAAEECNHELHSQEVSNFLDDVRTFLLVNHLYWGLWAVNQAAEEGCDGFDYLAFATNRFKEFYAKK